MTRFELNEENHNNDDGDGDDNDDDDDDDDDDDHVTTKIKGTPTTHPLNKDYP